MTDLEKDFVLNYRNGRVENPMGNNINRDVGDRQCWSWRKLQRKLNTDGRDESAHGPISLGTHVRGIRNAAGLTLSEISKRSGLSVSAISKIERDQISPTFFNLMRLAEGYGIHIADLVSTKQPRRNSYRQVGRNSEE